MRIRIPFGEGELQAEAPGEPDLVLPKPVPAVSSELEVVETSLNNPIGSPRLEDIVSPTTRVALLVSDITRPCPSYKILPHILRRLRRAGVPKENVLIVFATGTHRRHTIEEQARLVGRSVLNEYRVVDHVCTDEKNLVYLGDTRRGTPVYINSLVHESHVRIGVANIDAHYFAGYSGGAKSLLPGVAGYESIKANHKLMLEPGAETGRLEGNPVREDLEEAASMAGLEFIVNVVLDGQKRIAGCVSGHFIKAHRRGAKIFNTIYGVEVKEKYDIVIASPGGFPKDLNLYQAQKALDTAAMYVKPGGVIVLVAECREGVGNETTEKLLFSGKTPEEIVEYVRENFELGYHKAYAIARVACKAGIILVSRLPRQLLSKGFIEAAHSLEEALAKARSIVEGSTSIAVLPYAASIIPRTKP